jgi:4-hydroxy-2-oxoheptanedioate aldolase
MPAVGIVEIFAFAGFDFVIVDLEHGAINLETAESMMRAAHAQSITPIVRILANRPELITAALNIGAAGVLVPHVTGFDAARQAVGASRFGPAGNRGVCPFVRSAQYSGLKTSNYYGDANASVITAVALEGRDALAELEAILEIDGLDLVFVGPYDLSQSLGVTGETTHPRVVDAIEDACRKANGRGKVVGLFVEEPALAAEWVRLGIAFVALDVDAQILYRGSRGIVSELAHQLEMHVEAKMSIGKGAKV